MPNSNSAVVRPLTTRRRGFTGLPESINGGFWAPEAPASLTAPTSRHARRVSPVAASAARSAVEHLEGRQLMSVVYVSSSSGSSNGNGSQGSPVKTIARARQLLRNGDQMLLKCGDSWGEPLGDIDQSNIVIGSYGSGAKPRITTSSDAIWLNARGQSNVTLRNLSINASGRTTRIGVGVVGSVSNITIDNCEIKGFRNNANFIGSAGSVRNIVVRNSNLSNANGNGKSQGLFADGVSGITIENSTFDRNGGTAGSQHNHGVYLTGLTSNVVIRNSTFSNSSSHGLQARSGGTITGNKFINNSVGLSAGLVNGSGKHTPGGVTINISGNTFTGQGNWRNRGVGVEVGNVKSGTISGNKFYNGSKAYWQGAIVLARGDAGGSVGIKNLKISGNNVSGWGSALIKNSNAGISNLVVSGNNF